MDKSSQIQPELSRRILIPGRVGAEPANETVIIVAELAGVASFVVKGASLTLPRGLHTVSRAGVQQNRQSNGILFRAEECDRLRAAVFEDRDIGSRQPAHVAFLPVGNLNADRRGDWCPSVAETLRKRLQVARACGTIQAGSSYPPELVPGDIVITSRSCAREGKLSDQRHDDGDDRAHGIGELCIRQDPDRQSRALSRTSGTPPCEFPPASTGASAISSSGPGVDSVRLNPKNSRNENESATRHAIPRSESTPSK